MALMTHKSVEQVVLTLSRAFPAAEKVGMLRTLGLDRDFRLPLCLPRGESIYFEASRITLYFNFLTFINNHISRIQWRIFVNCFMNPE
jgi:hypothetical protein